MGITLSPDKLKVELPEGLEELFFDMSVGAESTEGVAHVEFLDIIDAWYSEFTALTQNIDPEQKETLREFFVWSLFKSVGKLKEHQETRDHIRSMFPDRLPKEFVWEVYGERLNFEDAKSKYEQAVTTDTGNKEALIEEAKHLARKEMNYDYAMDLKKFKDEPIPPEFKDVPGFVLKEDPRSAINILRPSINQRVEDFIESLLGEWEFEFTRNVLDLKLDILKEKTEGIEGIVEEEQEQRKSQIPDILEPDVQEGEFKRSMTPGEAYGKDDDESYYYGSNSNVKDFFRTKFYEKNPVYDMQGATTKKILAGLVKAGGFADIMYDVEFLSNLFTKGKGIVTTDHGTYLNRLANKTTNFWNAQSAQSTFNQFVPYVKKAFTLTEGEQIKDPQGNIIENPSEQDTFFSKGGKYGYIPNADGELVAYEISNKTQLGTIAAKVASLPWMINYISALTASKSSLIDRPRIMNEEKSNLLDYVTDRYPNLYKSYLAETNPILKQEAEMTIAKGMWQALVDKGGDWYGSGNYYSKTELTPSAKEWVNKHSYTPVYPPVPKSPDASVTPDPGLKVKTIPDVKDSKSTKWSDSIDMGVDIGEWQSLPQSEFIANGGTYYYNKSLGMGSYKQPKGYGDPSTGQQWIKGLGGLIVGIG